MRLSENRRRPCGRPSVQPRFHNALDVAGGHADERLAMGDVLGAVVAVEIALDASREVCMAGSPVAGGILTLGNAQKVVVVLDDFVGGWSGVICGISTERRLTSPPRRTRSSLWEESVVQRSYSMARPRTYLLLLDGS